MTAAINMPDDDFPLSYLAVAQPHTPQEPLGIRKSLPNLSTAVEDRCSVTP